MVNFFMEQRHFYFQFLNCLGGTTKSDPTLQPQLSELLSNIRIRDMLSEHFLHLLKVLVVLIVIQLSIFKTISQVHLISTHSLSQILPKEAIQIVIPAKYATKPIAFKLLLILLIGLLFLWKSSSIELLQDRTKDLQKISLEILTHEVMTSLNLTIFQSDRGHPLVIPLEEGNRFLDSCQMKQLTLLQLIVFLVVPENVSLDLQIFIFLPYFNCMVIRLHQRSGFEEGSTFNFLHFLQNVEEEGFEQEDEAIFYTQILLVNDSDIFEQPQELTAVLIHILFIEEKYLHVGEEFHKVGILLDDDQCALLQSAGNDVAYNIVAVIMVEVIGDEFLAHQFLQEAVVEVATSELVSNAIEKVFDELHLLDVIRKIILLMDQPVDSD